MSCFNNIYKNKKVLVTGHTGFKGSWLSVWLRILGADVFGLSDKIPTHPSHFESLGPGLVDDYQADICDSEKVEKRILSVEPDFVFHLAAQAIVSESIKDPLKTLQTNTMGSAHVLNALRLLDKRCVAVMITSDKCYENIETHYGYRETDALGGKDPYSASKAGAECIFHAYYYSYFKESNKPMATARAGNVIGGGDWAEDRLVPDLVRAWQSGVTAQCRKPQSTRPWQHVLEPLSGYLLLGQFLAGGQMSGESFNFGPRSEAVYSVGQVVKAISGRFKELDVVYAENPAIHDAGLLKLNCDHAIHKLHWTPVMNFEETIENTTDWYKQYYDNPAQTGETTRQAIEDYCNLARQRGLKWVS